MKLYYVEHSVLTTQSYAIMAEDEEHLKKIVSDREESVKNAKFVVKYNKDKSGKIVGDQLCEGWGPSDQQGLSPWDPYLTKRQ